MNPGRSRVETSTEFLRRITHIRIMSTQPMSSVVAFDHFRLHRKSVKFMSFGSSHLIKPREHFSFKSYTRTPIQLAHATNWFVHAMDNTEPSASHSTVGLRPLRKVFSYNVNRLSPGIERFYCQMNMMFLCVGICKRHTNNKFSSRSGFEKLWIDAYGFHSHVNVQFLIIVVRI